MTNDELAALILPWAKEHRPDPYELTIKASVRPEVYRNYLIRLIELRAEEDKVWRNALPLTVLEETGLTVVVRHKPTGRLLTVSGKKVKDRKFGFSLLWGVTSETIMAFLTADEAFDLTMEPIK